MQSAQPWNLARGVPQGLGNLEAREQWQVILPTVKFPSLTQWIRARLQPFPLPGEVGASPHPFPCVAGWVPGHACFLPCRARPHSPCSHLDGLGSGQSPSPEQLNWGCAADLPPPSTQLDGAPPPLPQVLDYVHQLNPSWRGTRHYPSGSAGKKVEHHCCRRSLWCVKFILPDHTNLKIFAAFIVRYGANKLKLKHVHTKYIHCHYVLVLALLQYPPFP